MTLKIEVTVPEAIIAEKRGGSYLEDAMAAIGFARNVSLPSVPAILTSRTQPQAVAGDLATNGSDSISAGDAAPSTPGSANTTVRERGKPSPGKARRTKEEIAEDEAADAAEAAVSNISTGEERHDPANPEDDAQDAADEAADPANEQPIDATREGVRAEMMAFVAKFGMPALNTDMQELLGKLFGAGVTKQSQIPETAEAFRATIEGLRKMMAENPKGHPLVNKEG